MPTVQCPRCKKVVRFEGVAGVCPNCASVVRAATKPVEAPGAGAPAARSSDGGSSRRSSRSNPTDLKDLQAIAGGGGEEFDPGVSAYGGPSAPLDKRVIYAIAGAVALLVLAFAVIEISSAFSGSKKPVVTNTGNNSAPNNSASGQNSQQQTDQPSEVKSAPPPVPVPVISVAQPKKLPTWANLKPAKPNLPPPLITDKGVELSLKRGVAFLKAQFNGNQLNGSPNGDGKFPGADALCVYALLHAGHAIDDEQLGVSDKFMKGLLDRLKTFEIDNQIGTYGHSLRLQALALGEREVDGDQRRADLAWLLKAELGGAFGYALPDADRKLSNFNWDHSNSQYGVLGVWAAADVGLTASANFWPDVEAHWLASQNTDGGWGYHDKPDMTTLNMTCAGITSLSVAAEQQAVIISKGKRDIHLQMGEALTKALDWIGKENHSTELNGSFPGYSLYGVERAALATGYRFFGNHDWYRELGAIQLATQNPDGSWDGPETAPIETAFRLLFLARGRQPLLLDKLRFDGNWNNRPRDAAKLAQFVSKHLEKTFAWSVADITRSPAEWLESPMLLITTDADPGFSAEDIKKFQTYVEDGGMILLNNEGGTKLEGFGPKLAARIFPGFPLKPAADDDLVYTSNYKLGDKKPKLMTVTNGSRVLMVYSPTDVAQAWVKAGMSDSKNIGMQEGLNIFVDAAGQSDFRNRLNTPYIDPSVVTPIGTIPMMRIKYDGNWDPEPGAYRRFLRSIQNQTSIAIKLMPVDSAELDRERAPIATLTGNAGADLSKLDRGKIGKYVRDGGVLLIDATGGSREFAAAVHTQLLAGAFPGADFEKIPPNDPMLAGTLPFTDSLPKPRIRNYTSAVIARDMPGTPIPAVLYAHYGNGIVIVSDLDLTTGLLGTNTYGIFGYSPAYCESFFKDVVLWTLHQTDHMATTKPATVPAAPTPSAEPVPAAEPAPQ